MDIFDEIQEATTKQLLRKQKSVTRLFPTFPDRVKAVASNGGVRLRDVEPELWTFKISSGTKEGVWYDIYLKFKNILPTLEKLVKNRRLWVGDKSRVDRKKLARKFMSVVNVELDCSCPADTFYGGDFIRSLGKYDAFYGKREIRPPRKRNRKQYGVMCKHLENLMKVLPFYNDTCMKWLEDFYAKDISRFEEEAKEELGFVKKVAKALGFKKKEKEESRPEEEPEEQEGEEAKENRDPRYSSIVHQKDEKDKRSVRDYLSGRIKLFAEVRGKEYSVVILDNSRKLLIKNSLPNKPVPSGEWMGWWEPDHKKFFGVSREDYANLPTKERAELEAKLQLKLWAKMEFWNLFASFYHPEEYDKWWWDEGGSTLSAKQGIEVANKYWEERLNK